MADNSPENGAALTAAPSGAAVGGSRNGTAPASTDVSPMVATKNTTHAVKRVMPSDFSISLENGAGATEPDGDYGQRKHSKKGFEDEYVDIVDYIVRVTHRIWEDQGRAARDGPQSARDIPRPGDSCRRGLLPGQ